MSRSRVAQPLLFILHMFMAHLRVSRSRRFARRFLFFAVAALAVTILSFMILSLRL